MRCVNDTLPPRPRRRWLLMTIRLSASSLAGTARTLVAVGTARLAVMLVTVRAAAPRSLLTSVPSGGLGGASRAGLGGGSRAGLGGGAELGLGEERAEQAGLGGGGRGLGRGAAAALGRSRRGPGRPGRGGHGRRGRLGRDRLGRRGGPGALEPEDRLRPGAAGEGGLIVGEEAPPGPVYRTGVSQIALVELFDEPFVGAEVGLVHVIRRPCSLRTSPGRCGALAGWRGCPGSCEASGSRTSALPCGDPEDTADIDP